MVGAEGFRIVSEQFSGFIAFLRVHLFVDVTKPRRLQFLPHLLPQTQILTFPLRNTTLVEELLYPLLHFETQIPAVGFRFALRRSRWVLWFNFGFCVDYVASVTQLRFVVVLCGFLFLCFYSFSFWFVGYVGCFIVECWFLFSFFLAVWSVLR